MPPSPYNSALYLIAHHIRSLYNVGSLFRTADGAGVDKIILSGHTGFPPREKISKVALGAEKTVSWQRIKDISPYLKKIRKEGFHLVALETGSNGSNYRKIKA